MIYMIHKINDRLISPYELYGYVYMFFILYILFINVNIFLNIIVISCWGLTENYQYNT
jgi:hypothetical protein